MRIVVISCLLFLAGCTTTVTNTVQECDSTVMRFIGIPITGSESCTTVSKSESEVPTNDDE